MVNLAVLFSDLTMQNVFLAIACFCVVGTLIGTVLVGSVIYSLRRHLEKVEDYRFRFMFYGVLLLEASFIMALLNASAPPLPIAINYVPNLETAMLAFEISALMIIMPAINLYLRQYAEGVE